MMIFIQMLHIWHFSGGGAEGRVCPIILISWGGDALKSSRKRLLIRFSQIVNNGGNIEDITILLVVASMLGMCAQYWIKAPWMYLITTILSVGMLTSVLDDYTASLIGDTPAMVLVIVAVTVILFSVMNYLNSYLPKSKQ